MRKIKQLWCGIRYKHQPSFIHITGDTHLQGHTIVEAEKRCVRCKKVTAHTIGVDAL